MYKKRTIIREAYKFVQRPSKSYFDGSLISIVKEPFKITREIFEVEGRQGYAKIIIEEGTVINAYAATWSTPRIMNKDKILNKFMQISQKGFIEVYKNLNIKSEWYEAAKQLLEIKKQRLLSKNKLTKAEKELFEL